MPGPELARATLAPWFARLLVVVAGAVVLVIETLAARLVAPYVGLTLESHTAAIGVALLGIAAGASIGGRLADGAFPRVVIAAGFGIGGALVFLIRPIVHAIGPGLPPGASSAVIGVALSTLAPVVALSMVPPAVVKMRLGDLHESERADRA
ncbi:MAG TPA: fused MFS/spermidine synthase, partial [Actinomycetota bacterium]|nr:fused MFS/spermidine synthase [Actinomycetota bacterium]